ncbi:N-acetylglucosamine-6-phosphate deacetylase [Salipaludibacillus keqinensis]|uniref:N-acetylglucosamine-6-phosphate deacetylase n=1 Tax=Salipaludibacillus keqinensis TaxID=2045207 RepID=A0A323TAM2_9BACI|nr:N-acetylglucosamine-6-phosphate deacetylase [Salipaludibacillus keqinensis]PYZ92070.1 N-acetylglucosamine-6-phosphate deacetylase [Salipaludibacillus keqinensis]
MTTYLFENATLFSGIETVNNPLLEIKKGRIVSIVESFNSEHIVDEMVTFPSPVYIVPGFIDIHIHGVKGADVMDGTLQSLQTMKKALPQEGTTSFLATTITQSEEEILQALQTVKSSLDQDSSGCEMLGVHLEGPFISKKRAGAQPLEFIRSADVSLFNKFQKASGKNIKLVTMAPEEDPDGKLVAELKNQRVIPSIGHSDASYEQVVQGIEDGFNHVTHLFNGMKGAHHRDLGVAGGALLHDELMSEMIVDGIHISPPMVKLAYQTMGADRIILITDAMRAKGLKEGEFSLGGQTVYVTEDRAVLKDGTLAGSVLKMNDAVKNMIEYSGCSLHEAVKMATINPAKQLGILDRKGSLENGKDADFCIVSESFEVLQTYARGDKVFG